MTIRSARSEDAAALARLAGELGYPSTADEILARIAALPPGDEVLVAESEGGVEAWIHLCIVVSLESAPFAEIRGLVVTESRRSTGIGAQLIRAAEAWASARHVSRLRVRTNTIRKRTHVFYERCGFGLKKEQRVYEKRLSDPVAGASTIMRDREHGNVV